MTFTAPLALLLLLVVPYFIWVGRPRTGRSRDWFSLGLRILIVALLVLSLAGSQAVRAADDLAVVFLVDASDSISPEQAAAAEAFVRDAIGRMGANDQAAVILFGANALVERPMSGLAELAPITSAPHTWHSDISEAIRLGIALFPAGSARRLVLLSDGVPTLGNTHEAARLAAAAGIPIDIVPLPRPATTGEAWLAGVEAPNRVVKGETFRINVTAESTLAMPARLRILAAGAVVYEEAVQLAAGVTSFSVRLRATEQEFARYTVQLDPAQDTFYQNNQLAAFTDILGPPRVLLVSSAGGLDDSGRPISDESPQIYQALSETGLLVEKATPAQLPADLGSLSNYAAVVLVNVNAKTLSPRKMETLQSYVRDLGGGLLVVGGPESYGMGGYFRTPLEETLPVDMQIKDQDRFPAVSIVIVIDRSGSMGVSEGSMTKIQLAGEAAVRVVELLNDFDEISVIPVDTRPFNPIGPLPASERETAIGLIRQISAGGGGIYVRTGLEAAAEALSQSNNPVKHIIVLADGADSEEKEGVPELLAALTAEGVTISMVSIGAGSDVPWLQEMAGLGNGRFHFTDRAANLPQIFTQETTSIQRSYLVEERFFPALGSTGFARQHPIFRAMEGAGITRVPPLYGYVGSSGKDAAQVILETHMGDPLLAAWEYGLGRSVAWTSDATGRWAADWVQWQGFPVFWAQAVRWTMSPARDSNVETAVTFSGRDARLIVDARDGAGGYLNNLELQANVVTPAGQTTHLDLRQVAPGRYVADFAPAGEGAYYIRVAGAEINAGDDSPVVGQTTGWVLGYSPEYRHFDADPQLLATVAELTGGRDLAENVAAVFDRNIQGERVSRPVWTWLSLLAVALLPLDIALRRLVVTRQDMARAWAATFGRLRPTAVPLTEERSEQVARLFQAKRRAGTGADTLGGSGGAGVEPPPILQQDAVAAPPEVRREPPPQTTPRKPPAPTEGGALASRLLQKKRQQQDGRDEAKS
jgi:uncharacterized membrane protein